MKNYYRIAAKKLIRSAAASISITPLQLIKLFNHANTLPGSGLHSFAFFMWATKDPTYRQACITYIEDGVPAQIPAQELTQPHIDSCNYLYHTIDNFYVRKVKSFEDLSFYPRIEDLFDSQEPTTEPNDQQPNEDFGELEKIGFVVPSVPTKALVWNAQQNEAFNKIHQWLRDPNRKQVFRLFGYAGTGKTEMSKAIADFVMNEGGKDNVPIGGVLFSAYTGKACSVMRVKGCRGADTLHSFLYKPVIDPVSGICIDFILNGESPLSQAALLIIDEASMVNGDMAQDILAFGVPVLVLGDPAQLPPVKGEGYFTNAEPDVMLTSIERQARDNPIIYLATRARTEKQFKPGKYGESIVYDMGRHVSDEMYMTHDQIICGLNATRKTINKRSRRINGRADKNPIYPVAGDKVLCTKNNKGSGLYNGTLWTSSKPTIQKIMRPIFKGSSVMKPGDVDVLMFKVRSLEEVDPQGNPYIIKTQCSLHHFNDTMTEPAYRDIAGSDSWEYGYALTVHKSQGSQFDSLLLFEESNSFREHRYNHLYTAITRAADKITIML